MGLNVFYRTNLLKFIKYCH